MQHKSVRAVYRRVLGLTLLFLLWIGIKSDTQSGKTPFFKACSKELARTVQNAVHGQFLPAAQLGTDSSGAQELLIGQMGNLMPLYAIARQELRAEKESGAGLVGYGQDSGYGVPEKDSGAGRELWETSKPSEKSVHSERIKILSWDDMKGRESHQAGNADETLLSGRTAGEQEPGDVSFPDGEERRQESGDSSVWEQKKWQQLLLEENQAAVGMGESGNGGWKAEESGRNDWGAGSFDVGDFIPHRQIATVNLEELQNYEKLLQTFYTVDSNTMVGSNQLQVGRLLERDLTLPKSGEPQILIYHTHSQEMFADSVPGDSGTSIVGVGEYLAEILRQTYGYNVLHHTGEYDVESRDNAYGEALPAIEKILRENPSIQVVIDLHRDQMAETTRLVTDLDGRPTAKFMFFNGLSRTKKTGDISYLKNENLDDNLAFSFQMQLKCAEYYPGLTRKIYLKGYRYNMHLRPRTLLVELGAQNNTVTEAMNACYPLAHVLDMVLSGEG